MIRIGIGAMGASSGFKSLIDQDIFNSLNSIDDDFVFIDSTDKVMNVTQNKPVSTDKAVSPIQDKLIYPATKTFKEMDGDDIFNPANSLDDPFVMIEPDLSLESSEEDWQMVDMPSMCSEEGDGLLVDAEAVKFAQNLELSQPSNDLLGYLKGGYSYVKDTCGDNILAIKAIMNPAPSPLFELLTTMKNIFNNAKNIALLGSAVGFMAFYPHLGLGMVGALIGASIYDNFIKQNEKAPWTNFILGTSLYSAAAISLFTAPWLALGLGLGCGSYIKNMTKALPLAVAGINIPDYLAGPLLLIGGFGVKAAEKIIGYNLPENCFINRLYKSSIQGTTSLVGHTLISLGYQHFESIGSNFINSISDAISLPKKGYDHYKPEHSFVMVDVAEKEMAKPRCIVETVTSYIPNISFVERLLQNKSCTGIRNYSRFM